MPTPDAFVVLRHEDQDIELTAGTLSPAMDSVLEGLGAQTWVFLPGLKLEKDGKLAGREVRSGRIHTLKNPDGRAGFFVFDLPRSDARTRASKLKLTGFLWGTLASPVELHAAKKQEDEEFDDAMVASARRGMVGMVHALQALKRAPRDHGFDQAGLTWIACLVLAFVIWSLAAIVYFSQVGELDGSARGLAPLFHPSAAGALFGGIYLRLRLPTLLSRDLQREPTEDEAEQLWRVFRPHLIALWLLVIAAVVVLRFARVCAPDFTITDALDESVRDVVIALWALTAIAYPRGFDKVIEAIFHAGFFAMMSLLMMSIFLMITNTGRGFVGGGVMMLLPFDISEGVELGARTLGQLLAAVGFLVTMMGYTWIRQRDRYVDWLSDRPRA